MIGSEVSSALGKSSSSDSETAFSPLASPTSSTRRRGVRAARRRPGRAPCRPRRSGSTPPLSGISNLIRAEWPSAETWPWPRLAVGPVRPATKGSWRSRDSTAPTAALTCAPWTDRAPRLHDHRLRRRSAGSRLRASCRRAPLSPTPVWDRSSVFVPSAPPSAIAATTKAIHPGSPSCGARRSTAPPVPPVPTSALLRIARPPSGFEGRFRADPGASPTLRERRSASNEAPGEPPAATRRPRGGVNPTSAQDVR